MSKSTTWLLLISHVRLLCSVRCPFAHRHAEINQPMNHILFQDFFHHTLLLILQLIAKDSQYYEQIYKHWRFVPILLQLTEDHLISWMEISLYSFSSLLTL